VPVRPVAPPATATATPDPVTLQPAPGFRSNLAEEMARRMAPLARAAAQRGDSAPAAPKQTAAPPPSASIQKRPKRRKRKPTRRGKRRPQTPGKRGRLGVPDEGYLLGPPVHGEDLYGRPFRTITIRVGRKVTRVERQRPDLLSLLPQEVKDEFPKLIRRAKHELWVKFKKEFNFTRPEELFQWLHASGPGWGVDVAPELFGPYLFNLSAQGHVENAVRRLAEIYGREGQGLFVTVTEYAHAPSVVSNGKWFVSEVVYTLSKGGVPNSQNTIVRTAIKAATPAEYAANGEVLKKTIDEVPNPAIDPGLLYQDVVNVAPEQFSPVKRGMIPDSE
jgi:hypothetical protein